jgi:hypothetical protein
MGEIPGTAPSGNDSVDTRWPEVQEGLSNLREQAGRVIDAIAQRGHTGALGDRLSSIEASIAELETEEAALLEAVEESPLLAVKIAELEKEVAKAKPSRERVNALLRQMVRGVTVDYPRGQLVFEWRQGGQNEITFAMPAAHSPETGL